MTAPQDPFASPPPDGAGQNRPGQNRPGDDPNRPGQNQPGYDQQQGQNQPGYDQNRPGYDQQQGQQQGQNQPGYGQQPGQPPYGQPAYGQPAYGQPPVVGKKNGLGIAALVLGILALLTSFVFGGIVLGIPAIILGIIGRGRVKRGEADNGGMALTGIILGVIALLISIAVITFAASFFDEFGSLSECLQSAGQDQSAIDQCGVDFEQEVTR